MNRALVGLLLLLFLMPVSGFTSDAEKNISDIIKQQVNLECSTCAVEIKFHNKELLSDIAVPDQVTADHWKGQTNLVLKLGDENRLITATIRWIDQVVVAKKNIKQGMPIRASDLRKVEKDVTYVKTPYLTQIKSVVGLMGKRVFRRGQIIDEFLLKKPIAVKYGQPVRIELSEGALSLVMSGKARGAGSIGDRIPVVIAKTRKQVFGKIIDKNRVRLE